MKRTASVQSTCQALFSAAALLFLAGSGVNAAETPATPILSAPEAASPPTTTPKPRSVSADTAARLNAVVPRYEPPPVRTANPETDEEHADKPRNGIIRLPRYIVREPKPPKLGDVQILTPKGKLELAMKQFPGLKFGSLGIFRNDGIAFELLEQELALKRKREAADLVSLLPKNAPANGAGTDQQRQLIKDAVEPQSSWTNMTLDHAPGH